MTEYIPVSWSEEPVSVEKLSVMADNDQALFEIKPTAVLKHQSVVKNKGVRMLAGSQLYQPSLTWATTVDHYFGNFFSAGCYPVVICNIYGYPQTATYIHPKGLGNTQLPDHRGFSVYVRSNERVGFKGTLSRPYYITYIAIGW